MALKKKFIKIEAPLLNTSVEVLETTKMISGKTIKIDLTRQLRGKSLEVVFRVSEKDGKLIALPKKVSS